MYSALNTLSEYISNTFTYTVLFVFKIAESLKCILKSKINREVDQKEPFE